MVWSGDDNTGSLADEETEIFGQRINAETGAEVGDNDFRISDMSTDGLTTFSASSPSVAYDAVDNEYLVVWFGDDNTGSLVDNEFEIFGQRLDAATGAEVGDNDFRISDLGPDGSTSFSAALPSVAYSTADNAYLVVWQGDDNTGPLVDNEFEIFGQRLDAATGAEIGDNDFRISDMGADGDTAFSALGPKVAYDSVDNEYLVVWEGDDDASALVDEEFEIFGQRINAETGAEVGDNDFRISDMGTADGDITFGAFSPGVSYNTTGNNYLVIWSGDDDTASLVNGEVEIYGQLISDPLCGNGIVETNAVEECDDGNTTDGDCCNSACLFEAEATTCDDGDADTDGDQCNSTGICAGTTVTAGGGCALVR